MAKKFNFKISKDDMSAELGDFGGYDGPKPPKGVYNTLIKVIRIKTNKNDDPMLNILHEISEPKGSEKAKYNGYAVWNNINVTKQSAAFINNFFDAIDPSGKAKVAFYEERITTDDEEPPNLIKVGNKKVLSVAVRVLTKDEAYQGEERLAVVQYMEAKDGEDDEDEPEEEAEELGPYDLEEEADSDSYTAEELEDFDEEDLRAILDEWEIDYPAKAKKAELIKLILAQYSDEELDDELDDEPYYPEEALGKMSVAELKEIVTDNEWPMPKPPIKKKLVAAILEGQAEVPF